MKYCLSGRQNKMYLTKADEIAVEGRDYRYISDLIIQYPGKTIILDIPKEMFDEDEAFKNCIIEYNKAEEINFVCRVYNLGKETLDFMISNNIKFYYGYSVNSFYDVCALIDLGVEYIKIHAPLTFNMDLLSKFNCKFRMVPNVAYDAYIPRQNGICGQWVRPEDVEHYENGIYVFEFEDAELDKERTLYNIYAEQKIWNGNIYFLISNINVHADNRGFPEELGKIRANCGQRCMQNGACHFCQTAFLFEKTLRTKKDEIKEMVANQKENN
jgi:hypothetical protein